MVFLAQVEPHLVDDLDAEVAEPVVPALGAHPVVDALADLVVHRRACQSMGVAAGLATGTLTAKATLSHRAAARRRWGLRGRRRLTQFHEQLGHLVARQVIAMLVGD